MKNSLKVLSKAFLMLIFLMLLLSCSSSDNESSSGSKYKITLMLNEVNETDDFVSATFVGNNQSGNVNYPLWRLNGLDQPNTLIVSLDESNFTGSTNTYVIETINSIEIFSAGFQIINYGAPLTGSIKIEKNGNILVNQSINLVGDNSDFTEDYDF